MKKIDVPISGLVSILIGTISLWVFFASGFKYVSYLHSQDLAYLSGQNIKTEQYVSGTISDCVTVPVPERQDLLKGSDSEWMGMGRTYQSYTVPIFNDQYIRVWIYDRETLKEMESIVNGEAAEVSFTGQVKAGGISLNTEWYDHNPEFDQSKIVAGYAIWQTTAEAEKNFCIAGFLGIVIAILIYYFQGRIQVIDVQPERTNRQNHLYHYNKENELVIAKKRLEMYAEQESKYRNKCVIGLICIIMGYCIVFVLDVLLALKLAGLVLIIYGCRKCWVFFINSKNRCAIGIARLFSMETLQTKRAEEENKIKKNGTGKRSREMK